MHKKKDFDFFSVSSNNSSNIYYEYMELQAYKQIAIGYFFIFLGTFGLIISLFNLFKFFMN